VISTTEGTWYSASDVLGWLGCQHRTALDARAALEPDLRAYLEELRSAAVQLQPDGIDGESFDSPAAARGDMHEKAMLGRLRARGRNIVEIDRPRNQDARGIRERADETVVALRAGADVVFQATLLDDPWFGYADFLVRVDGVPSDLGDYSYEVRDTKLARHPSASALLQMAHYGAILAGIQGAPPPRLSIWLGNGEEFSWDYADAAPYLLETRTRFLAFREISLPTQPEPVAACPTCRWLEWCEQSWGPGDLRNVHRLSRRQRTLLRETGIATIADLAVASDDQRPPRMATPTYDRLRQQAQAQTGADDFVIIRPQPEATSLRRVPPAHPRDIYFDLEGDPFAAIPTLDYLWAYSDAGGEYHHYWAHAPEQEQDALTWFLDILRQRDAEGGEWHVYHYNTYEITSLRRVAAVHPDPTVAAEVDSFIAERFIDLYRTVESSLRTRDGSTSLKVVEKLAGYDRAADAALDAVTRGDDSILEYERFILSADEAERAGILARIRAYNAHDVRATKAVHDWIVDLAGHLTEEDLIPEPNPYVSSDSVDERIRRTDEMVAQLATAADSNAALPSGLSADGARLLAHMLQWHRAEMIVSFLDGKRLEDWARQGGEAGYDSIPSTSLDESLNGPALDQTRIRPGTEQESVLVDVEFAREVGPKSSKSNAAILWEYRCRPGSWKIREGKRVKEVLPPDADRNPVTYEIEWIDPQSGAFRISRRERPADVEALVLDDYVNDDVAWESLMRLAEGALSATPARDHLLGFTMLDRTPPLPAAVMAPVGDEDAGQRARRLAHLMSSGLLPIQGPPGTGKTYVGARLIGDAVSSRQHRPLVIAIAANSHKVINNLMLEAVDHLRAEGIPATFGHVGGKGKIEDHSSITHIASSGKVREWVDGKVASGESVVIGATKFALCRPEVAGLADVLVIDEAGQLSLADACAVAQAAPVAIALGDPQQLTAPVQASHDASVDVSLLEHVAQGASVLPDDVGVFLDLSYRMHPAVCTVVGDLAYSGELESAPPARARDISGPALDIFGRSIPVQPGVVWVPVQDGDDEVEITRALLDQLVDTVTVTVGPGLSEKLAWNEVRVVSPHNAHVNRLTAALPDRAQVGTVDRFQGQQGHVVVYSMGRLAESPGDVPFLYEINRLNVALSRARVLAIVVSHADAVFPPVISPDHLLLASRFIRAVRAGSWT
jgi:uncharacterized protein